MKKGLTLLLIFCSAIAFAQIKITDGKDIEDSTIGEYKTFGTLQVGLTKIGDKVKLTYRDAYVTVTDSYKSFTFSYDDLETIYTLFSDFSKVKKGDEKIVELEDGHTLYFRYGKTLGKMHVTVFDEFADIIGKVPYMNKKQTEKVFGKR